MLCFVFFNFTLFEFNLLDLLFIITSRIAGYYFNNSEYNAKLFITKPSHILKKNITHQYANHGAHL